MAPQASTNAHDESDGRHAPTSSAVARRAVGTVDGRLFILVGASHLAPVPAGVADPSHGFPREPGIYLERLWSINSIPYQALVPVDSYAACRCRLLRCLNYHHGSVPLELKGKRWYLRPEVFHEWRELEALLVKMRTLTRSATSGLKPPPFSWPEPVRYGYGHGDEDDRRLTRKIIRSRAAFILLLAEIAYSAARQRDFWEEMALPHFGRHVTDLFLESWVARGGEGFRTSASADVEVTGLERVGVFVDVEQCDFGHAFERFIQVRIPLWFAWGRLERSWSGPDDLRQYFPSSDEQSRAWDHREIASFAPSRPRVPLGLRDLPHTSRFHNSAPAEEITEPWGAPAFPVAKGWGNDDPPQPMQVEWTAPAPLPPPTEGPKIVYEPVGKTDKHHGQRLRESWQDFFARREAKNTVLKEKETPEARQTRLQREEVAAKQKVPGSKGAAVFMWSKDEDKGYLLRRHVYRGQVEDAWMEFKPTQRRYDGFRNEWDLNYEFDPSVPDVVGGDYDDDDDDLLYTDGEVPADQRRDEPSVDTESMGRRLTGCDLESLQPIDFSSGSLEDVLRLYHGIHPPVAQSSQPELTAVEVQKVRKCKTALCSQNAARDADDRIAEKDLAVLVDGLVARGTSQRLPSGWLDLNPSCPKYVGSRLNGSAFKVVKVVLAGRDERVYSITDGQEKDYELVVERASTAMMALRQRSAHTLDALAEYLCTWGMRLSTCKRLRTGQAGPRTTVRAAERIPYRLKGFQPNMEDYQSYVGRRRQLFRSGEVVRAALKHGGVVWRLALEETDESYVTSGPTSRVTEVGDYRRTADGDELWDEKLTEDQIDVICGVYKVEREEVQGKKGGRDDGRGRLTEHVSWFPKDASWRGCGMDVGFWSSDAETWYQRRVARYLGGDFKCENQTEWKRSLKLWRDAPKTSAALEKASEEFLDRHVLRRT